MGVPTIMVNNNVTTVNLQRPSMAIDLASHDTWLYMSGIGIAFDRLESSSAFVPLLAKEVYVPLARKRCLFCSGGGHFFKECVALRKHLKKQWMASPAVVGALTRAALIYFSPSHVQQRRLRTQALSDGPWAGGGVLPPDPPEQPWIEEMRQQIARID